MDLEQNNGACSSDYDWAKEVAAFEETRSGVKGLVDSGVLKIPKFFIQTPAAGTTALNEASEGSTNGMVDQLEIPTVDLRGIESDSNRRKEAAEGIRRAAETWGFFRMTGHGVPTRVMEGILEATRRFHELPKEEKMPLYSAGGQQKVRFFTINGTLEENQVANWRDALALNFPDGVADSEAVPPVCRKEICEYLKHLIQLKEVLCELLSEALGLSRDYLGGIECMESEHLSCLYYPPCPEPDRTFGLFKHSDTTFLTIVVQDDMGGLQVLHQDSWVDVTPVPGALLANIGDLMQLITNDKFKSAEHRVVARSVGSRVSTACFFFPSISHLCKPYGPIKELLSENNPPLYREVSNMEYTTVYQKTVKHRIPTLPLFKLR